MEQPNGLVTTLVGSGLYRPYGVAVDAAGNVYVADTHHDAIEDGCAAQSNPSGRSLALDYLPQSAWPEMIEQATYIADYGNSAIEDG